MIAEVDASDAILVHYTYGDDLISQERAGATSYYHYDGLGSTRALSDDLGSLTDSYDYEAFGEVLKSTGETENSYLYTGEQFDANLDQYYLRARYYDHEMGRMTQFDTYEGDQLEPLSLNKYVYVHADPVNNLDPSGNITLANIGASLRINGVLSTASTRGVGKSLVNNLLVGKSGRDTFGIVGETVIEQAKEALLEILLAEINGDLDFGSNKVAQKRGTAAHNKFEERMKALRHSFKNYGIDIRSEVFRFKENSGTNRKGQRGGRREKGTLGIDVEILRNGKRVLAFDLKTGAGFSGSKNRKLQGIFGTDIVEIFVGKK